MDRFLDPGYRHHAMAARFLEVLLSELAQAGRDGFDREEVARRLISMVEAAGEEPWLGEARDERLIDALERIVPPVYWVDGPEFWSALALPEGLEGRPWYRNPLWAPGLETGYAAESLPTLRAAAARGPEELDRALEELLGLIERAGSP